MRRVDRQARVRERGASDGGDFCRSAIAEDFVARHREVIGRSCPIQVDSRRA